MARTVSVTLTANTAGFTAQIARAASATKTAAGQIQSSMDKALSGIEKNSVHIDRIGSSLGKMGIVGAAGLALTAKAAIDWESAWAGVTKTVDGSASQMADLEGQLRGLAKTLPASHEEIAGVAEAAGQLGVQRENITSFTRTMIDLGETTNLSADEAATSIKQMMNVMGTADSNVGRMGATIVALGNAGASTERDIVQMGQRIAAAGRQVGLSETEVLGFSNALASVGIDAEAGGTAISTSFLRIDQAVRNGGKSLGILASTAGMSSKAFSKAFQEDAAGALTSFVTGLGKVQAEGGDTTKILSDLGITGIREADALRRLASSGTLLSDSLNTSNQAWRDNSALVEEAAKRYATTESQARIAWNQIKDAAISGGQAMLPIISQVATVVGKIAESFGSLPSPVRIAAVSLVAAATAMGLIGGGTLKALTGIASLRASFTGLSAAATGAGRAMKIAQLSIPGVGIALFAATTALQYFAGKATASETAVNSFADAMQTVEGNLTRATAAMNDNVRAAAIQNLQQAGAFDNAKQLGLSLATVTDASLGNADAIGRVNEVLKQNLTLNPQMSKQNSEQRNAAEALAKALGLTAHQNVAAVQAEKDRRAAMEGGAGASQAAGQAAEQHAQKVQQETDALNEMADAAIASANALLQISGSQIGMEAAIDAATKAAKDNGRTLDINTAKGRANQQALDALAGATVQLTNGMIKNGESAESVVAANERGRSSFIKSATAMGMSKKAATELANSLFLIPAEVRSQVVVAGGEISRKEARDLNKELRDIPAEKRAEIVTIAETKGAKAAKQAMDEVHAKDVLAKTIGDIKGAKSVDGAMKALRDRLVKAKASGDKRGAEIVKAAMDALKNKSVNAKAVPSGEAGVRSLNGAINALHDKTVTVRTRHVNEGLKGATGGLFTEAGFVMRGPLRRSTGGPVWGAGTATSDSIPALLSNGEFVINAKSVSMIGADRLAFMNRTGQMPVGYATGGIVSGIPKGVDINRIYALITALTRPLAAVSAANTALGKAQSVKSREDRELTAARTAYERAVAADKKRNTKRTEAAKDKAKAAYDKAVDQQRTATEKLTTATNDLRSAQQTLADSARQESDRLSAPYRSGSSDIMDWLESMKQGAAELKLFQTDLAALRKLGVSETIVQQIADQGAVAGSELAKQILAGGRALAGALNTANGNLQKSADALGYDVIQATGRYALGGPVFGPGTGTSDSITARLSNGEYVVNAAATAANRPLLDHINYGRSVVAAPRFAQTHYAHGGFVRTGGGGVSAQAIAAAVEDGLSRASFTAYLDGQPFRMIVKAELRQTGRTLARSA